MHLTTERLILRPFVATDWHDLYAYLSDLQVVQFEPYEPFTETESRLEADRRAQDPGFVAVCLKTTRQVIGNVCQFPTRAGNVEIGYVFNRGYWGKGYAAEAAGALIDALFQQPETHRVFAECNPENVASENLLRRLGLRLEARLVQNKSFQTQADTGAPIWQDTVIYAILRDEWLSKRKPNT